MKALDLHGWVGIGCAAAFMAYAIIRILNGGEWMLPFICSLTMANMVIGELRSQVILGYVKYLVSDPSSGGWRKGNG